MQLTIVTEDGSVTTADVQPSDAVSSLAPTIAAALSVAPAQQRLLHNSVPLDPRATFAAAGVVDGDLIMVLRDTPAPVAPAASAAQQQQQQRTPQTTAAPRSFGDRLRANPALMARLRADNPALAARVDAADPAAEAELAAFLRHAAASALPFLAGLPGAGGPRGGASGGGVPGGGAPGGGVPGAGAGAGAGGAGFDPMSADAQAAIEERIRAENVQENMEAALEHNPESFGRVVMLFVDCKINSVSDVKAFVDSGAQTTIISKACAERCNILRLLDTRFQGVARGVGTAKIYGRIHLALLTLGAEVFEISLTVMDGVGGGYDVLLGLDMLRKHAAVIDLGANVLRIGAEAVPFLAEKDIPLAMRDSDAASDGAASGPADASASAPAPTAASAPPAQASTPASAPPTQAPASAPAAAAASPAAPAAPRPPVDAAAVKRLVELGFAEREAVQALHVCGGDADQAAALLMQTKYGM